LVKVPSLDVQLDDSLPVGVLPVSPIVANDKLDVAPLDSNSRIKLRYSRRAFPLIPTRCITDYKAQGSGFKRVVVDLDYPPSGAKDFGLAVYVMVSRAKTLATLYILRAFDSVKLMAPFPEYIRAEWRRMVALSSAFIASRSRS